MIAKAHFVNELSNRVIAYHSSFYNGEKGVMPTQTKIANYTYEDCHNKVRNKPRRRSDIIGESFNISRALESGTGSI